MKFIFVISALISSTAFAENIPVRIECKAGNGFVRSASKSMGSPYYYEKETLLDAGTNASAEKYIIQNQNFDMQVGVAHMTGESVSQGYSDAFDLMINLSSGTGTFIHGNAKVALTNCQTAKWN